MKKFLKSKRKLLASGLGLAALMFGSSAFAGTEITDMVATLDFTDFKTGVVALFTSLVGLGMIILAGSFLASRLGWHR